METLQKLLKPVIDLIRSLNQGRETLIEQIKKLEVGEGVDMTRVSSTLAQIKSQTDFLRQALDELFIQKEAIKKAC